MPFYLLDREPIATGLRRIAHEQIAIALRELGDDDLPVQHRVHSLRSRSKKLRGLLRLPGPLMSEAFEIEDRRFHAAARAVAAPRDQAVCARTIFALEDAGDGTGIADEPIPAAAIEQARETMAECETAVDTWPLPVEDFADLAPGVALTYRKCLDAWHAVRREPGDVDFHRLRKWTKYHWYQIRILERLNRPALHRRRKHFRRLQLILGDAHDLALLQARLTGNDERSARLLRRAIARKEDLYAQAVRKGRRAFERSADELVADLARYWADRHAS
jgi:CHAD domain-containing protein